MTGARSDRRSEVHQRLQAVRALLDESHGAGVVLGLRRNFAWLTAGGLNHVVVASENGAASILVTRDEAVVLAPVNEAARIEVEELAGLPIEVAPLPWDESGALDDEARRRAAGPLLDESALEPDLARLRSQLTPFDHHRLRAIAADACLAMAQTLETLQPTDTEQHTAGRLLAALAETGTRASVLLAAADERIARYRHPLPTATPVRQRLMIVLVAERWGLHVALTRSRAFEPPSGELARRMDAVETIQESMHRATRASGTLGDVMAAARLAYKASGFPDEWRLHHQGGVIGYQPREQIAVPGDPTPIRPGMAFAWNPSVAGAKAEDTVVLETDERLVTITDGGLSVTPP